MKAKIAFLIAFSFFSAYIFAQTDENGNQTNSQTVEAAESGTSQAQSNVVPGTATGSGADKSLPARQENANSGPNLAETNGAEAGSGNAEAAASGTDSAGAESLGSEGASKRKWPSWMDTDKADVQTGFRVRRKTWQVGINNMEMNVSNSWFKLSSLLNAAKSSSIDLDDYLTRELDFEAYLKDELLAFRFPIGSLFTLNVSGGIEADTIFDTTDGTISSITGLKDLVNRAQTILKGQNGTVPTNPTQLSTLINNLNGLCTDINNLRGEMNFEGEAFAYADVTGEKTLLGNKLWIKAGPSFFVPILYAPNQTITMGGKADNYKTDGTDLTASHRFSLGTAGALDAWYAKGGSGFGADLSLEARYAIWPVLDAGFEAKSIPLVPAKMTKRFHLEPMAFAATVPSISGAVNGSEIAIEGDLDSLTDSLKSGDSATKWVMRPMRFAFYGIYKPFRSTTLLVRPEAGFSVKYMNSNGYKTFNWGLEAQWTPVEFFSATIGIKLFEKGWSEYFLLVFDFHAVEFDLGLGFRGPSFTKSWSTKGARLVTGFKFGW